MKHGLRHTDAGCALIEAVSLLALGQHRALTGRCGLTVACLRTLIACLCLLVARLHGVILLLGDGSPLQQGGVALEVALGVLHADAGLLCGG